MLEPNPPNGQKKLLLVFATMIGFFVFVGIIATIASP